MAFPTAQKTAGQNTKPVNRIEWRCGFLGDAFIRDKINPKIWSKRCPSTIREIMMKRRLSLVAYANTCSKKICLAT